MGCCQSQPETIPNQKNPSKGLNKANFVGHHRYNIRQHFKINSVLGQGGFAKVYSVTDIRTNTIKAMKELKKVSLDKSQQEKIIREVQTLRNLDHPNIMKVFQLVENQKSFFIITQFLEGGELFDHIIQQKHFTQEHAAKYFTQFMTALSYLHSLGIVHRDLKPENLVFSEKSLDSPLKIIDFGISKSLETQKVLTETVGTLLYMAPEIFQHSYDEKCDIWSSGVILYVMLSGNPPFYNKDQKKMIKKIQKGNPSFSHPIWKEISNQVKDLIESMLDANPKKRPSAQKILKHKWIKKHLKAVNLSDISSVSLSNLKQFHTQSKLEKSIRLFISSQIISTKQEQELITLFQSLDQNSNGYLCKAQLIKGYQKLGLDHNMDIDRIFNEVDLDSSGEISFTEFVTATQVWNRQNQEERLQQAFQFYDQGGDGFLCLAQLREALPGMDNTEWAEFIEKADVDQDGKISFNEFRDCLFYKV